MRKDKRPTHTSLVVDALRTWPGDLATIWELTHATGSTYNQVSAAVSHLKKHRVIDSISDDTGTWWYLTHEDGREWVRDERTPEERPRRPRNGGRYKSGARKALPGN